MGGEGETTPTLPGYNSSSRIGKCLWRRKKHIPRWKWEWEKREVECDQPKMSGARNEYFIKVLEVSTIQMIQCAYPHITLTAVMTFPASLYLHYHHLHLPLLFLHLWSLWVGNLEFLTVLSLFICFFIQCQLFAFHRQYHHIHPQWQYDFPNVVFPFFLICVMLFDNWKLSMHSWDCI